MAKGKKKGENPQGLKNVEETLTKTEQFLESNYKALLAGLGVIVLLVGLIWLGKLYLNNRNDEAQVQMYQAQRYLESDSLNLARYCAGICFLHLGHYEEAIDYLGKYSKKDKVIGSLAIGAIGDAYVELGDTKKGLSKYLEAAEYADNSFNTPVFLMKAAELYEMENNYSKALQIYQRIKDEYPESTEGTTIDKYIARVKILSE